MASDLSSGCTDDIEIFDEKEEGEISLEDVSSSEESHPNYRASFRNVGRCPNCRSFQQCSPWCNAARIVRKKFQYKQDADHGKENRRHVNDSSGAIGKHVATKLQEKNEDEDDDLVPISSDSDMEIVGLPSDSTKSITSHTSPKSSKVRKKKKKKRSHSSVTRIGEAPETVDKYNLAEEMIVKVVSTSRSRNRESASPRYNSAGATSLVEKALLRSPSRRYRPGRTVKSRSPLRRSRSPVLNHANATARKLSRKLRSSRRTSSRSPGRLNPPRESRLSLTSPAHVDVYATKLLKKVRHLESVGTSSPKNKSSRSKEHSSLKEKLSNMLGNKETVVRGETKTSTRLRMKNDNNNAAKGNEQKNDEGTKEKAGEEKEEEEDIELLRRLALETKQKKMENKSEEETKKKEDARAKGDGNLSEDNDTEALELRMIALHSAVMKKHRNRVERGLGSKKRRSEAQARNESPFSVSFLDSIPIPDEFSDASVQSPISKSPLHNDETNNPEDMDLDTDVEREKESMPYSPTDDLTDGGINVDNDICIVDSPMTLYATPNQRNLSTEIINSNVPKDFPNYLTSIGIPYPPSMSSTIHASLTAENNAASNSAEKSCFAGKTDYENASSLTNCSSDPEAPSKPLEPTKNPDPTSYDTKNMTTTERPYSPTDAPISDPELTHFTPDTNANLSKDIQPSGTSRNNDENAGIDEDVNSHNLVPLLLNMSMNETETGDTPKEAVTKTDDTTEIPTLLNVLEDLTAGNEEKIQSYEALMDELPEIDLDGSPLVPVTTKESSNLDINITLTTNDLASSTDEPLYLQGLTDASRDTNKIPTLVNRILVPVPILKTNKQLQQPLPQKKIDIPVEPSFKSAEMRPVSDNELTGIKTTKTFKPIRLCSIAKKPQTIMQTAAAFNSSLADDSIVETSTNNENEINSINDLTKDHAAEIGTSSTKEKSKNADETSKKTDKIDDKKSGPSNARSKSSSPMSRRSGKKVLKKNDASFSGKSSRNSMKSSNNRVTRKTSGSSSVDEQVSRKRTSNEKDAKLNSSTRSESTDFNESSSEANGSKNTRKKATRRGGHKCRARRQRAIENAVKATSSENLDDSERTKKSPKDSMERDDNVSTGKENKAIELKIRKNVGESNKEASIETNKEEHRAGEAKSLEKSEKKQETEKKRRCSLDEDEEALRALLLASLPKRAKIVENATPEMLSPIVKITRLSDTTSTEASAKNSTEKVQKALIVSKDSSSLTTPKAVPLSSQTSSSANSANSIKANAPIEIEKKVITAKKILTNDSSSNFASSSSLSSSPITPKKRLSNVAIKNPPKKITKKALPVIASMKVVNNAKKYQNAMLQKKLNLQRAATLYSAATGSRNITLNNMKTYENARPSSPMMTNSSSKMQRLVINLESDTDSEADSPNEDPVSTKITNETSTSEQRKPLSIPTTDFEKSVVQFLKDQRKKIESIAVTTSATNSTVVLTMTTAASPTPSSSGVKDLGIYNTPLAVRRHLPVSQQEEYRRLKQQIIERERQMLQKTMENGTSGQSSSGKSSCTPPGPLSPSSAIAVTLVPKSQSQRLVAQATSTTVATSREKCQEKIGGNGVKSTVNKLSNPVVSGIAGKSLSSSVSASPKILSKESNAASNPANTSTPKASSDIRQSSNTSTLIAASKEPESSAKSKISSIFSRTKVTSSSVPTIRNITTLSASTSGSTINSGRISLKAPENLTIRIPNNKCQTNRSTLSSGLVEKTIGERSDGPENGPKSVGALRILTKEQLNNKFVKIQVEKGPSGRKVIVGSTNNVEDDLSTAIDPHALKTLPKIGDNTKKQYTCCDSSLSFNESKEMVKSECSRNNCEKNHDESTKSDASTLVLSRNDNLSGNDSTVSTLILARNDSQICEKLESTSRNFSGSETSSTARNKENENQFKVDWKQTRLDIKEELKALERLSVNEQEELLLETQENLVAKRNTILEDLTEMAGSLRQWEFECEIQTKLIAEVRRLREQLKMAEERLNEQRRQMNDMAPRVTKTHEKINRGREECYVLSKICQGLGARVKGPNYKIPNTSARLLTERLKEVAMHTRQLSKLKIPALNNSLRNMGNATPVSSVVSSEQSIEESTTASLSEIVNRMETSSASMSETDHDDEDNDNSGRRTAETEASIGSSSEATSVTEIEKQKKPVSSLSRPASETNSRGEESEEFSKCTIIDNPPDDSEPPCSSVINASIEIIEDSRLSERNVVSRETKASLMEKSVLSGEPEVPSSSENDASTSKIEVSNSTETSVSFDGTEAPTLAGSKETSKATDVSNEPSSSSNRDAPIMKNSLSIDTIGSNDSATSRMSMRSPEINVISIVTEASDENHTGNDIFVPGTSRSESPSFRLLGDSQSTGKQKLERYNSVLTHLKTTRTVDPNGILCPYELMGTCNDGDCQYFHLDPDRECQ